MKFFIPFFLLLPLPALANCVDARATLPEMARFCCYVLGAGIAVAAVLNLLRMADIRLKLEKLLPDEAQDAFKKCKRKLEWHIAGAIILGLLLYLLQVISPVPPPVDREAQRKALEQHMTRNCPAGSKPRFMPGCTCCDTYQCIRPDGSEDFGRPQRQ